MQAWYFMEATEAIASVGPGLCPCPSKSPNRNLQIPHRGDLCQGKIALPLQVWSIRPVYYVCSRRVPACYNPANCIVSWRIMAICSSATKRELDATRLYQSVAQIYMHFYWHIINVVIIIIIIIQKICSPHISTLLGAQGANPETPGQAPSLSR